MLCHTPGCSAWAKRASPHAAAGLLTLSIHSQCNVHAAQCSATAPAETRATTAALKLLDRLDSLVSMAEADLHTLCQEVRAPASSPAGRLHGPRPAVAGRLDPRRR